MALTALFGLGKNPTIPPAVTPQQVAPPSQVPPPGSKELDIKAREKALSEEMERATKRKRSSTILTGAKGQLVTEENVRRPTLGGK